MQDSDPLYEYVRTVMMEVMAILYANGKTELHVGALMRLVGVPDEQASEHDNERIEIDDNFLDLVKQHNLVHLLGNRIPAGATIH